MNHSCYYCNKVFSEGDLVDRLVYAQPCPSGQIEFSVIVHMTCELKRILEGIEGIDTAMLDTFTILELLTETINKLKNRNQVNELSN